MPREALGTWRPLVPSTGNTCSSLGGWGQELQAHCPHSCTASQGSAGRARRMYAHGYIRGFVLRNYFSCPWRWARWCSASSPRRADVSIEIKGRRKPMSQLKGSQTGGAPTYSREDEPLVLLRPSTDWVRPTHLGTGNLLISKGSSHPIYPHRNPPPESC